MLGDGPRHAARRCRRRQRQPHPLLRDTPGNGVADLRTVLLDGLSSPFGMALVDNSLYVATADVVLRFP